MDIKDNSESYGDPSITFSDQHELDYFRLLTAPNIQYEIRNAISYLSLAPIEFPYTRRITHYRLNRVLGTATMLLLLGNEASPNRELEETFVREISEYYSRLGQESNFEVQNETTEPQL